MATLQVHGTIEASPERSALARGLPPGAVHVKAAVRVQAARAGVKPVELTGLLPSDVVEIELDDGVRLWSRVDDLAHDFGFAPARGAHSTTLVIPGRLTIGGASRGVGGWTIKGLKIVGLDLEGSIGDFIAERVEGILKPGPGLYRCSESDEAGLRPIDHLEGDGPVLVFLHGTASSTSGSFGGLWRPGGPIGRIFQRYGGRVLAFQHETLTKSPIENAAVLAARLAKVAGGGADIHLVSHSRGGLVGELLACGMRTSSAPFSAGDLALFAGAARARDRKALGDLNRTLRQARFSIGRFVRVACPARGTTLADGRLDRYFSIFVNLAGFVPGLQGNPAYDALTSLLAGVLKQRTRPEELPGLEAMMPGSPLVAVLNRPDVETSADLHVLGGDLAGTGVFGRLKTLATDFFYREDHDLVVNTPAMLGGGERAETVRYWIDTGSDVTHFHYFTRDDTSSRLVEALEGKSDRFHPLRVEPFAVTAADYRKRAPVPLPVVFVLPGIMGSELSVGEQTIWMSKRALALGGLARIGRGAGGVEPTGVVRSAYGALCQFLSATHDVVPFAYDWRQSIEASADLLAAAFEKKLDEATREGQPVRLLAHSMGGLVVRAMLNTADGQALWARACRHPGARFLMLGTPNGGSHAIAALLMGRDSLVQQLALLDLTHDYRDLLGTITDFDGVLDLLPHEGTIDLYGRESWQRLARFDHPADRGLFSGKVESSKSAGFKWPVPSVARLGEARRMRDIVRSSPLDPHRTIYVAGLAPETACDVLIDEPAPAGRRVRVLATAHGDGRVPWKTGIPPGLRTFYMDVVHGDMASEAGHFPALLDLLESGTTSKLSTTPPRRRSSVEETFELRREPAVMVPDEDELVASALGGRRRRERARRADRPSVTVRIVHDNLKNAQSPVLVGHYEHDVIVAAEKYLDGQLSNRLSDLQRMELYPGPLETAIVVLNEQDAGDQALHPGAIVAGLGMVGEMTPGRLTATLTQALVTYGAECVGRERRRRQRDDAPASSNAIECAVSAVLVGSGEAGVMLTDSLQALLRGVAHANERLALPSTDAPGDQSPRPLTGRISRLDIYELYEDRAIEAVHAMRTLAGSADLPNFVLEDLLVPGPEGQRRARGESAQAWYQRVRVSVEKGGALKFEALTQLARANESLRPTQRRLVDAFVDQAVGTTEADPALGHTLFELLVPNSFKVYAPDRRRLLLVLDQDAAALPWELLHDRFDKGAPPLAVASGMIRQLLVEGGRDKVTRAPDRTALVVGDPVVGDERFPALPGAAEEAAAVAARLTAEGYSVTSLIGEAAHPLAVLSALHQQPWRIVHLAAHGVFEFDLDGGAGKVSGLVLDGGVFLTSAEAEQMRYVPELLFINCCHLGQTREDKPRFDRLAANLATQFIRMGARAVVAAGWAVDDAAAKTFARAFYAELFNGRPFGEAVARARRQTYDAHADANTWGAYQCYGDPAFSLARVTSERHRDAPAAPAEVVLWAEQIARNAAAASPAERGRLLADLDDILSTTPALWMTRPSLCAAVAAALAELGEFERGMRLGEALLTAEVNDAPIAALEQLANLKVRWAGHLLEQRPFDRRRASRLLDEARSLLEPLLKIGDSAERLSLMGSLWKRRAMLASGASRVAALREMARAYAGALDRARKRHDEVAIYPLGNRVAADLAMIWQRSASAAERRAAGKRFADGLTLLAARAREFDSSPAFFDQLAAADHLLLSALGAGTLDADTRRIVLARYQKALRRGVSPRRRRSARDQLWFFQAMMTGARGPRAAAERAELRALCDAFDLIL